MVWESNTQDGSLNGVYAQRFASTGSALGSEFRVNTDTTNTQADPAVAMDSAGDFVVAWQSYGQDGSSYGIYAQLYASTGSAVGSEFRVNIYTTGQQSNPSVAMDSAGDFVVAWESLGEDGNSYGVFDRRYNSSGTERGKRAPGQHVHHRWPVIAFDRHGFSRRYCRHLDESGPRRGLGRHLRPALQFEQHCPGGRIQDQHVHHRQPKDAVGGRGFGRGYCRRLGELRPRWQRLWRLCPTIQFDWHGQGSEFRVNTYTKGLQGLPSVAIDSVGDFVVAWESYTEDGSNMGVYAQQYNSTGVARGMNSESTRIRRRSKPVRRWRWIPRAISLSPGRATARTAACTESTQRYVTAKPATVGSEFRVNTYTASNQEFPKVASDAAGDYVVVWESYGPDGSGFGIVGQRDASTGSALGSEFVINTYTTGIQRLPTVAMDSAGDFVVAWQSFGQATVNEYDTYAQRYNASGVAQGSEFLVNSYITGGQDHPSVAMDSAGDFVIAWQSFGQDGSNAGIEAERFNASGTAQERNSRSIRSRPTISSCRRWRWMLQGLSSLPLKAWAPTAITKVFSPSCTTRMPRRREANSRSTPTPRAIKSPNRWPWTRRATSSLPGRALPKMAAATASTPSAMLRQARHWGANSRSTATPRVPKVSPRWPWIRLAISSSLGKVLAKMAALTASTPNSTQRMPRPKGTSSGSILTRQVTRSPLRSRWIRRAISSSPGQAAARTAAFMASTRRRYTAPKPTSIGGQGQVNTYTTGSQEFPKVASDAAGDYVVVWESYGEDGSGFGIFGQRYASTGSALGSEFQINTYTTGIQRLPSVAMDSAGDFVVAWQSFGQAGNINDYAVYAQRYASTGSALGSEFLVNNYTSTALRDPSVAMDSAVAFVIAWDSFGQDGSLDGVYGSVTTPAAQRLL